MYLVLACNRCSWSAFFQLDKSRARRDDVRLLHIITLANMHLILNYTVLIILLYQCITIYGIEHEQFKDDFSYDEPKPGKI